MTEKEQTAAAVAAAARLEEIKARLRAALIKKSGSLYRASLDHGRPVCYTQRFFYKKTPNLKSFLMLCEWAGVSPRYVLNGGKMKRWQGTDKLSFDGLFKAYDAGAAFPASIRVLINALRRGDSAGLNLKTILIFAELSGADPADLIGA